MIIYADSGFTVKRDIFEIKMTKEYSSRRVITNNWMAVRDLAGDYLEETKSFYKSAILVIVSLTQSANIRGYCLEFFEAANYTLK